MPVKRTRRCIPDNEKTKEELLQELKALRARVAQPEQPECERAVDVPRESEEKYRSLIINIPEVIWTTDIKGNTIFISPTVEKVFGYSLGEIYKAGDSLWFGRIHPDDVQKVKDAFEALFEKGKRFDIEYRIKRKDRKWIWLHDRSLATYEIHGVKYADGIFSDITERKKAEEELRKTRERLEQILATTPATTYTCKVGGNWPATFVSETVKNQFGYEPRQFVEDPNFWSAHIHPDDRQRVLAELSHLFENNFFIHEYRFLHKDGSYRWVHDKVRLIRDKEGKPYECIGYWIDITERKKGEQKLRESEEKYRQVVSTTTDAVMLFDAETRRFVEVNKACEELYGYSREEFLNLKHSDITAEPKKSNESIEKTLEGKPYRIPVRYHRKKDGTVFPVEISASTFELRGRKILCGVVRDITERLKAEEKIRKLSSAVEQSIDGTAIGDLKPRLLYVNEAFARMHGYSREEMIGTHVTKLHNKEQLAEYRKALKQLKKQGSWEGEIGHIRKNGTVFTAYVSITLLRGDKGKPVGTLAVARDITESKQREKELNIYRDKMVRTEQLASLGTLSATLAHKLTQPLTVVRLSIENFLAELNSMSYSGAIIEGLNAGLRGISNAASIVRQFRNFAKESSENEVKKVDLKTVAERIIQLLEVRSWQTGITMLLQEMDKLPPIYSYEKYLEQLFFALVENAIEAANGKKGRQLTISGTIKDEKIELKFSDNCSGIAPEILDRIFEPFFTTKTTSQATGLGLCIVEHIVSRVGGKVRVESKPGEGSIFIVALPIR